jgi:hypothetical protein
MAFACLRNSATLASERSFARPEQAGLRRVHRRFAMNGATCEPLATWLLAGDLDEARRRGSRQLPCRR